VLCEHSGEPARAIGHYRAFLDLAGTEHAERVAGVRGARLEAFDTVR
jgi:hypothetical protein